jgi:hypothetical protein
MEMCKVSGNVCVSKLQVEMVGEASQIASARVLAFSPNVTLACFGQIHNITN